MLIWNATSQVFIFGLLEMPLEIVTRIDLLEFFAKVSSTLMSSWVDVHFKITNTPSDKCYESKIA